MDETYRMLGREHAADLDREAANRRLADQARQRREPIRLKLNTTRGHEARQLLRALVAPLRAREGHLDT